MALNVDFLAGCVTGSLIIPALMRLLTWRGAVTELHRRVYAAANAFIRWQSVLHGKRVLDVTRDVIMTLLVQAAGAASSCNMQRESFLREAGDAYDALLRARGAKENRP